MWSISYLTVRLSIILHLHFLLHHYIIILLLRTMSLMCKSILTLNYPGMPSLDPSSILPFPMTLFALLFKQFPRGSSTRRVVMDLSFPPGCSINDSIPQDTYLGKYYKLQLPGIDWLVKFILEKGRHCLALKKDLSRAYHQFPIDPKDYHLLGFHYHCKFYLTLAVLLVYVPRQ